MYVMQNAKNDKPYLVYKTEDDYITNGAGDYKKTLLGTVYGTKPQQIDKNMDALALLSEPREGFMINIKNPQYLKQSYILKASNNMEYIILNDCEFYNGEYEVTLVVSRIR